jgi:hypothetical protein
MVENLRARVGGGGMNLDKGLVCLFQNGFRDQMCVYSCDVQQSCVVGPPQ